MTSSGKGKGPPLRTALPEHVGLEGPWEGVLAEITPDHHTKTQTFLESHDLIRHWITSFQLLNMSAG